MNITIQNLTIQNLNAHVTFLNEQYLTYNCKNKTKCRKNYGINIFCFNKYNLTQIKQQTLNLLNYFK